MKKNHYYNSNASDSSDVTATKLGPVIDKYNPFYKTKEYYTVVNTIGQHVGDEWYEYEFIAFDERGKEQK